MKKTLSAGLLAIVMPSLFVVGSAQAATCNVSSVTVTAISVAGGPTVDTNTYNAAECAGAYTGSDIPVPGTHGGANLGYYGDGLFNGAAAGGNGTASFPNGIFSSQYVIQDLNNDGVKDPGWIFLGSWIPGTGFTPASIGGVSDVVLSNWFTVTGSGNKGTWAFTPDAGLANRLPSSFGGHLFDQFALSFMSGNSFAAYDFTAKEFGMPLSPSTIFNFSGSWDMSSTLLNNGRNAGNLSHVDLYVRDPLGDPTLNVPEPATLALVGLGLLGMFGGRRRSASK